MSESLNDLALEQRIARIEEVMIPLRDAMQDIKARFEYLDKIMPQVIGRLNNVK